ncbi:MAG: hypothetical protein ABW137_08340 [Mycobacterium sp.]
MYAGRSFIPAAIEQQTNRVNPQSSRVVGIILAVIAGWSAFRALWLLYVALTFDGLFGSLVISAVVWGGIGVVAAIGAVAFLARSGRS